MPCSIARAVDEGLYAEGERAGPDTGGLVLPCEFCNDPYPVDMLIQHQVSEMSFGEK